MTSIGKLWAGRIFGTNTGNVFVKLANTEGELHGEIKISDDKYGIANFEIVGVFDGSKINFKSIKGTAPEGIEPGEITVSGVLLSNGSLKGEWSNKIGTGGAFILHPHVGADTDLAPGSAGNPALQEQVFIKTKPIGALRLYADDVRELLNFLRRDFAPETRVIVNYFDRGNEVSKYATDFEADFARLRTLKYLRLHIQEVEAYGIARSATVTVNSDGANEIRTQGVQESWVMGKAENLAAFLKLREKSLATTARRFGLNLNFFVAIIAVAALPELTFVRRLIFAMFVVFGWVLVQQLHNRFIPNVLIYLSPKQPSGFDKAWPQALSWTSTIASGVIVATIYGLLKGDIILPTFLNPFH